MRFSWMLATAGVAALAAGAFAGEDTEEAAQWAAKARQSWAKSCRNCHTVPAVQFETGRAWLSQIKETS